MPTNHDETLHERYAREHQSQLAIYARMTPEQISDMATELHNALARLAALESQQAASVGGEREAFEAIYGVIKVEDNATAEDLAIYNLERRAFTNGAKWRAAISPAGGGVVMPEPLMAAVMRADDVLHALAGWDASSAKLEQRHGDQWVKEVDAIRRELHTQLARLNAKPQANSQEAE